ncbi:uncharacterized protein N7525_004240 [Penicillium rubens]|uniref:uncharacterized protein n=1 Tax=Penicillium rubens TaxID=1108849 RepID=UPI002A5A079C|nr:uncharacterized protein N7525_004240 [Penicillium rubens]KAJ5839052.1 hypothetical protein N7525_004240 [Penicillium rubens]KAJ5867107.1 hypothetical protein N7534_001660 [Penicillium rubens]
MAPSSSDNERTFHCIVLNVSFDAGVRDQPQHHCAVPLRCRKCCPAWIINAVDLNMTMPKDSVDYCNIASAYSHRQRCSSPLVPYLDV